VTPDLGSGYDKSCSDYRYKCFLTIVGTHIGIGTLARRTGVKIETIRYYEHEGLLPSPPRTPGGHRAYGEDHVKRLMFIRRSRQLGFSMQEIRTLLELVDGGGYTCGEVKALTLEHAEAIREKIADLQRMEATLTRIAARCEGGDVPDCPVIDALLRPADGLG